MNQEKKPEIVSPYMSKSIYNNYKRTMKEKNLCRKKARLTLIPIKSYEQWSSKD